MRLEHRAPDRSRPAPLSFGSTASILQSDAKLRAASPLRASSFRLPASRSEEAEAAEERQWDDFHAKRAAGSGKLEAEESVRRRSCPIERPARRASVPAAIWPANQSSTTVRPAAPRFAT